MAERFKGINLVIGGETKGLTAALGEINAKAKNIQSELRGVEALLKMDPGNTALIAQKQELLTKAISETKDKLDALKSAQAGVDEAFQKGEIHEGAYRDFQREIASTEQKLAGLRTGLIKLNSARLDNLKASLQGVSDKLNTIGTNAQNLGAKISAGLTIPLGLAAKTGIEYNAQMEQYAASFATMLGDDIKAAEYLADLKEFAAKTPFEMTDLANASKTLLAFGRTAVETQGDMQMLGDISQGNAQTFESLTRAFGKVASAGKMTGEDLNMMIDAGFNPLQIMSEKTGKSMQDLRKDMEGGKISFEDLQDAMTTATSEGGMFYGSMDKQSKTLNGQLSTLKDTFMTALGEGVMPLSDYIKNELIPKMTELIEKFNNLSPGAKTAILIMAGIAALVGPSLMIIGSMARGVSALTSGFGAVVGGIQKFTTAQVLADGTVRASTASRIASTASLVGHKIATLASTIATNAATVAQKALNLAMKANPIILIVSLIAMLVAAFITLWNTNEGFRKAVIAIWDKIKKAFSGVVDFIKNGIKGIADFFKNLPGKIWDGIKDIAKVGLWLVQGLWDGIKDASKWILDKIKGFGKGILDGIKDFFGINSPSKVFQDDVGFRLGEGMALGIENSLGLVKKAMNKMNATASQTILAGDVMVGAQSDGAILGAINKLAANSQHSIVLNTGQLVGATVGDYNMALGKLDGRR